MLIDLAAETLRSLRAHALRYGLTSLGIAWGILMLTYLTATMDGYERHFERQIGKLGPRVVYLFPGWVTKQRLGHRGARPVELEREDVARMAGIGTLDHAGANLWLGPRIVRADRRTKLLWSYGASADTLTIRNYEVDAGRAFTQRDIAERRRVVFLGAIAAERLFGDRPALGQRVQIDSVPFEVIGVSREKGEQIIHQGPPDDELAWIPVSTAQRWFTRGDVVGQVVFEPITRELATTTTRAVRALLGLHHDFRPDDDIAMSSFDIQEVLAIIQGLLLGTTLFLSAATVVTLLVGAAGVMNIMLVVVTERTREIGLRKAIGASNGAIFTQFLAETVAVSVASGSVGALLGWLLVTLSRSSLAGKSTLTPTPELLPGALVTVALTMIGVGVLSGILPAIRASRIEPAVSLRAT